MQKLKQSPTLNTILMVEETLKNMNESAITVAELKRKLPKKINHNMLKIILEYLEESNKIYVGMRGVTWIVNNNPVFRHELSEGSEINPSDFRK